MILLQNPVRVLLSVVSVFTCLAAVASLMGAKPHPTPANRLVETIDGVRIEYSPGQEAYLRPIAERIVAWNGELDERQAKTAAEIKAVLPLSARDLRENRTAVLQQIAIAIGLDAPTPLQGRYYDAMREYYEYLDLLAAVMPEFVAKIARTHDFSIWERPELIRRLSAGENLPGFTYDQKTKQGDFSLMLDANSPAPPEEQAKMRAQSERQRLDHAFNYKVDADGVAHISASFNLDLAKPAPSAPVDTWRDVLGRTAKMFHSMIEEQTSREWPVILSEKNAGKSPEEVAEDLVKFLRDLAGQVGRSVKGYRDANLAMVVLHETAEVGIVERYIGSADRRWLCDGTANYVAWKVARNRAGPDFARQVYNLDGQLIQFAAYQKKINLWKWPAVERQREEDRDTPLTQAHYAFATRALFLLAQAKGEDALPKLFQEIGRTPRAKVSMKTVAKAYRKIAGADLDALIKAAVENPIPLPAPK
jgi:hypothetical protein